MRVINKRSNCCVASARINLSCLRGMPSGRIGISKPMMVPDWKELTKRILKEVPNIHYPLSGGLDPGWSGHLSVGDPTNNDEAKQDRPHTYY